MPTIRTDDGLDLYYEEVGSGIPIVFVHEFAGDLRSYEPQMRYFSHSHRCIAYNARGYAQSGEMLQIDSTGARRPLSLRHRIAKR